MLVYTAEPGSPSQDGLNLLASWAATLDQQRRADEAGTAPPTANPQPGRDAQR